MYIIYDYKYQLNRILRFPHQPGTIFGHFCFINKEPLSSNISRASFMPTFLVSLTLQISKKHFSRKLFHEFYRYTNFKIIVIIGLYSEHYFSQQSHVVFFIFNRYQTCYSLIATVRYVAQLFTDLKIVPVGVQMNGMFQFRFADGFEEHRAIEQRPKWSSLGIVPANQTNRRHTRVILLL